MGRGGGKRFREVRRKENWLGKRWEGGRDLGRQGRSGWKGDERVGRRGWGRQGGKEGKGRKEGNWKRRGEKKRMLQGVKE